MEKQTKEKEPYWWDRPPPDWAVAVFVMVVGAYMVHAVPFLSNACKFTERGTITLTADRERNGGGGDWLVFRVADSGIGMTAEQMAACPRLRGSSPPPSRWCPSAGSRWAGPP